MIEGKNRRWNRNRNSTRRDPGGRTYTIAILIGLVWVVRNWLVGWLVVYSHILGFYRVGYLYIKTVWNIFMEALYITIKVVYLVMRHSCFVVVCSRKYWMPKPKDIIEHWLVRWRIFICLRVSLSVQVESESITFSVMSIYYDKWTTQVRVDPPISSIRSLGLSLESSCHSLWESHNIMDNLYYNVIVGKQLYVCLENSVFKSNVLKTRLRLNLK